MAAPGLDNKIVIVDIDRARQHGISVKEIIELMQLGVFLQLDIYQVLDRNEAYQKLKDFSQK